MDYAKNYLKENDKINIKFINNIHKILLNQRKEKCQEKLNSNAVYRIMSSIMWQIVFTKKEIEEESGVSKNTVSTLIDKLVEFDILVPYSNYAKRAYRYNEIYNVFIDKDMT